MVSNYVTRFSTISSRGGRYEWDSAPSMTMVQNPSELSYLRLNKSLNRSDIRRSPIEFSIEKASYLKDFILRRIEKDLRFIEPDGFLKEEFGSEFKRFCCALEAYRRSPNPVIRLTNLLNGLVYKEFASDLKKIRDKSYRTSIISNPFEIPEDYDDIPYFPIKDIGDIFNYNYWIFWKEDDCNDIDFSFLGVKPIEPELCEKFKNRCLSILPDFIDEVDEREILLSTSGSTCYNPGFRYVYQAKESCNSFSSKPLHGRRSIIRISPDNTRDAIILPVEQVNSVRLIEKQVYEIVKNMDGSAYVHNEEEFADRCDRFFDKFDYFLDRDIKKEGLTKPRQLIHLVFDCLEEKYPDIPHWKYRGIYNNFFFDTDQKKAISTYRGHGLGMANALTTLIQLVLFHLIKDELVLTFGDAARETKCLAFNDDFTSGFTEEYLANEFWDIEDAILNDFQIIRSPSKSYLSRYGFSFCERYYPREFNEKHSYKLTEIYNVFSLPNISVAKHYVNNLSRSYHFLREANIMKEIVSFWGYEFFPSESSLPFMFGGWITPISFDVDISFSMMSNIGSCQYRAYLASKASIFFGRSPKKRRYKSPLETVFGDRDYFIPDEFNRYINYGKDISEIDDTFSIRNDDNRLNKAFNHLYEERQRLFKQTVPICSLKEIYFDFIKDRPLEDILPPESLILEGRIKTREREDYKSPSVPNPILSMIKYFNHDKITDSIPPIILKIDNKKYDKLRIFESHMRSAEFFSNNKNFPEYGNILLDVEIENGNESFYLNPLDVVNACFATYKRFCYPIVRDRRKLYHDYDKYSHIRRVLSSNKVSWIFKYLVKDLGYQRAYEISSAMLTWDEEDIQNFLFKTEEPQIEREQQESVKDLNFYSFREYPRWEVERPPHGTYKLQDDEFFNRIYNVRNQLRFASDYHGSADRFSSSERTIQWCRENEIKIQLAGGYLSFPRDDFVFIRFPSLDDQSNDSDSEEDLDIDIFD